MTAGAIAQALDDLYEAAVPPEAWPKALHGFARAAGSVGCLFYPRRPELTDLQFPASPDIGDFMNRFRQQRVVADRSSRKSRLAFCSKRDDRSSSCMTSPATTNGASYPITRNCSNAMTSRGGPGWPV